MRHGRPVFPTASKGHGTTCHAMPLAWMGRPEMRSSAAAAQSGARTAATATASSCRHQSSAQPCPRSKGVGKGLQAPWRRPTSSLTPGGRPSCWVVLSEEARLPPALLPASPVCRTCRTCTANKAAATSEQNGGAAGKGRHAAAQRAQRPSERAAAPSSTVRGWPANYMLASAGLDCLQLVYM